MSDSTNSKSRNAILLTLAVGIGLQIPTSTLAIQDALTRSLVQAGILIAVILVSIKVQLQEKIPKSPPPPTITESQPDTIPDPPTKRKA